MLGGPQGGLAMGIHEGQELGLGSTWEASLGGRA